MVLTVILIGIQIINIKNKKKIDQNFGIFGKLFSSTDACYAI